jgi:hypothetical protein
MSEDEVADDIQQQQLGFARDIGRETNLTARNGVIRKEHPANVLLDRGVSRLSLQTTV